MRGCIKKRARNSYTIVISLGRDPTTGKLKQDWRTVRGSKKQAEKYLAEMLHQQDTGMLMKPGKTTLSEFLARWLKEHCEANLGPHTTQTYQFFVDRHINPTLGHICLTQLKPEHLQRLYADKLSAGRCDHAGGLGNRSVRYIHTTLHNALSSAVKLGLIARNPADAVEVPKVKRHEMHVMSETDIHAFLEAAKSTSYYALFHMALFTGMRRSELLALRWCDVDLLLCQAHISRSLHHLQTGETVIRPPKTAKGRRMVALSPSVVSVLREHREKQTLDHVMLGTSLKDDDFIFSTLDGKPLLPDSVTHAWLKLARRVGFEGVTLHGARHTHASLMLKQGVHPKIVQERLGHASIGITLDIYSHVAPGLQEAAANRFDELVTPEREKVAVEKVD